MREYLKALRATSNFTQEKIAQKLGVTQQYYQLIENGERQKSLKVETLSSLAKIFNKPIEELLKLEQDYLKS